MTKARVISSACTCAVLLGLTCGREQDEPPREGEPLWILVLSQSYGPGPEELRAYDISDPGAPRAQRIVGSSREGIRIQPTPWGAVLLDIHEGGWRHDLVELDANGDPLRTPVLVRPEVRLANQLHFSKDNTRMLAEAHDDEGASELWAFEFDHGRVVDQRMLADYRDGGGELETFGLTPSGDAALWTAKPTRHAATGPLMMASLSDPGSQAVALTSEPVSGFRFLADKLVILGNSDSEGQQQSSLLPADDLSAPLVPGPSFAAYEYDLSDDGRWLCDVSDDTLRLVAFDGLAFEQVALELGEFTTVDGCNLSRDDMLIYETDTALVAVELSGGTPSAARALISTRVDYFWFSPRKDRLIYTYVDDPALHVEIVDLPQAPVSTRLLSLVPSASFRTSILDDDRLLLQSTAVGGDDLDLWLLDYGADASSATATLIDTRRPPGASVDYPWLVNPRAEELLFKLRDDSKHINTLWRMPLTAGSEPVPITATGGVLLYDMALVYEAP